MDSRAIGVFDSGLGGLCSVRELEKLLPKEHIIYLKMRLAWNGSVQNWMKLCKNWTKLNQISI